VVREQVERRGGAEVYAGKGKDRKELKKAHRLEPSREPAIQLPVSHVLHHRGVKGWPVKCHVLGAAAPRPPRKRHSVRPGTGPLCHPGAGQEQVRTRTEGSGLGVTSAIGRGPAAPAPPRSGQWVGRAQRTGGSVAVPSVRRQCIGAPVGRT
jgi:hypothetical protein